MKCCGYLSGARHRLFAYGPADATAIPKPPTSLATFKFRLVLPYWYWLTKVVLEKRLLNGCSVVAVVVLKPALVHKLISPPVSNSIVTFILTVTISISFVNEK